MQDNKIRNIIFSIFIIVLIGIIIFFFLNKGKKEKTPKKAGGGKAIYFILNNNEKYGVVNIKGDIILQPMFSRIVVPDFSYPLFFAYNENEEQLIFNESGKEIKPKHNIEPIEGLSIQGGGYRSMLKYKEGDKYGFIDLDGEVLTNAKYTGIESLNNDKTMFLIRDGAKLGLADMYAREIVAPKYAEITSQELDMSGETKLPIGYYIKSFQDSGSNIGFIDKNGKEILEPKYEAVLKLEIKDDNNFYLSAQQKGKQAIFKNNKKLTDFIFQDIFSNNVSIIAKKDGKYGQYNLSGKELIAPRFSSFEPRGNYITFYTGDKSIIVNKEGKQIGDQQYKVQNIAEDKKYIIAEDKTGEIVIISPDKISCKGQGYLEIFHLFNDDFVFRKNEKYGVVNFYDGEKIPAKYDYITKIVNMNIIEAFKGEKKELYNFKKELIPFKGEYIREYLTDNSLVIYNKENKLFLDKDGNIRNNFELIDNKYYSFEDNGKYGFKDKSNNVFIKPQYDRVSEFNEYGYASVCKDGKWGSINEKGDIILSIEHEFEGEIIPKFLGKYLMDDTGIFTVTDITSSLEQNNASSIEEEYME